MNQTYMEHVLIYSNCWSLTQELSQRCNGLLYIRDWLGYYTGLCSFVVYWIYYSSWLFWIFFQTDVKASDIIILCGFTIFCCSSEASQDATDAGTKLSQL